MTLYHYIALWQTMAVIGWYALVRLLIEVFLDVRSCCRPEVVQNISSQNFGRVTGFRDRYLWSFASVCSAKG